MLGVILDTELFFLKVSKSYLHIDFPLSQKESEKFFRYLTNISNIKSHRFLPLIQFEISFKKYSRGKKLQIKKREISLVSHHDAGVYALLANILNQIYNQYSIIHDINNCSVAYRTTSGLSNIQVAKEIFDFIDVQKSSWVMKGDFKGFFDNLDHHILIKNLVHVLNLKKGTTDYEVWIKVIKQLENFQKIDREKLNNYFGKTKLHIKKRNNVYAYFSSRKDFGNFISNHRELITKNKKRGIPQGTGISGVLANVYMILFDKEITTIVEQYGGIYRRYSDDFIIVLPKSKIKEQDFNYLVTKIIDLSKQSARLTIETNKTKKFSVNNGIVIDIKTHHSSSLDYLGFILQNNTVSIRPKSIYKYYYRGRKSVTASILSQRMYNYLNSIKDYTAKGMSATEIYNNYISDFGGKKLYNMHPLEKHATLNRVKRIMYHQQYKVGVPEVKRTRLAYLQTVNKSKPRESFLSYIKLVNKVFNEGSFGYKLAFKKQADKTRRKFYKIRKNLS